jgi:hypothetical protein
VDIISGLVLIDSVQAPVVFRSREYQKVGLFIGLACFGAFLAVVRAVSMTWDVEITIPCVVL